MTDATPQFLNPGLGSTIPRPLGLRVGDYPHQTDAAAFSYWSMGIADRALRAPFGDTVGTPLHYEYDLSPSHLLGICCTGDPENPDDRSIIQSAQDNPPQVGRVFTTWWWFDWRHSTANVSPYWNRGLASRSGNAYLGQQTRGGTERPVLAVTTLAPNGGTFLSSLTNLTLVEPGNATKAGLDSPLLAEDGSAAAPQPLRVPCWIGRYGFAGAAGQVLAAGTTNQNLGFFLKLVPVTLSFTENAAALKIEFTGQTAEYGCEVFGACAYTLAQIDAPATYSDTDFLQPGPPYPCRVYGDRCWKSIEQTAYVQIFLTPLGDSWQAVVAVYQVRMERSAAGGRYVLYSNFSPGFYTEKASLSQTKLVDGVSATPVAFGTTTTITQDLFAGAATLEFQIDVSATGKVTLCEARIQRNVTVTNLGPGWHDKFVKL
jgi:hypothetical protein